MSLYTKIKQELRNIAKPLITGGLVALLSYGTVNARDLRVPAEYPIIQEAINDSIDGDTVIVFPGTYIENINFNGKNITLKSYTGPKETIVRGGVTFNSGETNKAVLEGFTITEGGGIYCRNSGSTIRNNIISKNSNTYAGGITCYNSNIFIIENFISDNYSDVGKGGGIACTLSEGIIKDNIILGNEVCEYDGGGLGIWISSILIKNNLIFRNLGGANGGGGIAIHESPNSIIKGNLIIENDDGGVYGGGIVCYSDSLIIGNIVLRNNGDGIFIHESSPVLIRNTIINNVYNSEYNRERPNINSCIIIGEISNTPSSQVFYSDISQEGFDGTNGNISENPYFVNPNPDSNTLDDLIENGDFDGAMKYLIRCFSLQPNSPCIDAGDPGYFDPDGTRADIGAIYFDRRDIYRDGFIDFRDFTKLSENWLKTREGQDLEEGEYLIGDINKDGKVDYNDLEELTENWLSVVPVYGGCED